MGYPTLHVRVIRCNVSATPKHCDRHTEPSSPGRQWILGPIRCYEDRIPGLLYGTLPHRSRLLTAQKTIKSTTKKKTLNPEFGENFKLTLDAPPAQSAGRLAVFDYDIASRNGELNGIFAFNTNPDIDLIGETWLHLKELAFDCPTTITRLLRERSLTGRRFGP